MRITNNNIYIQIGFTSAQIAALYSCTALEKTGEEQVKPLHLRRHSTIPYTKAKKIISGLSFPGKHTEHIRSIVLAGSTAYNLNGPDSDIDVVLISTENGFESVQTEVCEKEIDDMMNGRNDNIEYTVLSTSHIHELLQLSSPFIFSILHGSILMDDGYLADIRKQGHLKRPGTAYFIKSLRENVLAQYFGAKKKLYEAVKLNKCSESCCKTGQKCWGLPSANIFAKTIMRMLYITLPARGYMPLTKSDAVDFSREVYGNDDAKAVQKAAELARNDNAAMYYADYLVLKRLAVKLYRESLVAAGMGHELNSMLRDVSNLMRGNYHQIQNGQLRTCVV